MPNLDYIRQQIGEGNLRSALSELLKMLERSDRKSRQLRDGVIVLNSKFEDLSRKETLGILDTEEVLREKAQINYALLNIIGDIETGVQAVPESQTAPSVKKWWWLLLLIPVGLAGLFRNDIAALFKPAPPPDGGVTLSSQAPAISFSETTFDFGTVNAGTLITHTFRFRNTGTAPLQITGVTGSSDCTVQHWPQEPIPPGGSGEITVEFNSQGKTGSQRGQITVVGNMDPSTGILTVQGTVRGAPPVRQLVARFRVENNNCEAPCNVKFINTSNNAVTYSWEFGDGQTARTNAPTHQYVNPGTYNVLLKATAADGVNDFSRQTVTVKAAQPATTEDEPAVTTSWGWKRVTPVSNIDDANNFLNGNGSYSQKIKNAAITKGLGTSSDMIIFYQKGASAGWGWKRVTQMNLDDANNFLNGTGGYSKKINTAEIFPVQQGSGTDLILFYQSGQSAGWGWKRVTNLDMNDALNFLNGAGAYSKMVKNAAIVPVQEGGRTDLIIFYQTGQSAGQWKQTNINDNNALQTFLGTTKQAEVVTVGNKFIVFYKK